jgi:hypothetical protein
VNVSDRVATVPPDILTGIADWFEAITTGVEFAIVVCPSAAGSWPEIVDDVELIVAWLAAVDAPVGSGKLAALTG